MKRTRKWEFVEQEAGRLAALGLSQPEIAKRLGVNRSTVSRWMKTGKLTRTGNRPRRQATKLRVQPSTTPAEWSAAVRKDYDLDATDDQLVTLAEVALGDALDVEITPSVRLAASGRFQAIVRQLALVARGVDEEEAPVAPARPQRGPASAPRASRPDPRSTLLTVVR